MNNLENILIKAASMAGELLKKEAFTVPEIEYKKVDDPVTRLDREAERMIKTEIGTHLDANFLGEEYGLEDYDAELTFIIDPLDGTKSYLSGDFQSSVSIAIERKREIIAGCVYDFMRGIMYVGAEGTLRAYAVSSEQPFQSRRVGNKIRLQLDGEFVPSFDLFQQDKGVDFVKKGGSIALNMVHCAFGLYDGMLDYTKNKGNVWDVAAGYYFLKQRDYLVLDKDGQKFEVHHPQNGLVALHPKVAPYVLNLTGLTK